MTRIHSHPLATLAIATFAFMSVIVDSISRNFGEQKALDNVSFSVKAGQVAGFLGPNGAGKSTMMKIITCFLPQSSGRVTVEGFDVVEEPLEVRKKVGYLPEHNPLYPDMYVKEFLEFAGGISLPRKEVGKSVKKMIEITGLGPEQHKKIAALSKGYRQRVGLAQAMIHEPSVLILDEPTTGLDPNQLVEIRQLIRNIGKEKTVILSTHIMQEVEAICDRAIIINKGVIVADDETPKLRQALAGESVVVAEFDKPVAEGDLMGISGVKSVKALNTNTWRIKSRGTEDIRSAIFRFAVEKNIAVITLRQETGSLEEVFRQLTNTTEKR